jgi:hemolysin activation/secretion protein
MEILSRLVGNIWGNGFTGWQRRICGRSLPWPVLAILFAGSALAAEPPLQGFEPNQIERQIEGRPAAEPPATPVAGEPARTRVELAEQSFVLAGVLIEGATVYPTLDFLPFYQPYLGTRVTVSTLRSVAEAITRHYQKDGYFLSNAFLPAQDIEFGVVRIRVIEGYLASWSSPGSAAGTDPLIAQTLEPLLAQRPARKSELAATVAKIGALPGLTVRPQVRAVPGQTGAYELLLPIERRRFDGSLSIDNRGSEFIGPVQGVAGLRIYDLTHHHESYQLKLATVAEARELSYADVSTEWLLGLEGLRLQAGATHVSADPGGSLEPLDAHIENDRIKLGITYRPPRTMTTDKTLGAYLSHYHSRTDIAGAKRLEDRLTTANVSYRQVWLATKGATYSLTAALTRGLSWNDSAVIDTQLGAGVGSPEFTKLNLGGGARLPLDTDWDLTGALDGQYARDPLPSSERYSVGGAQYGRAYDPSEITGDHGLAGRLELDHHKGAILGNWRFAPYIFYDLGAVWQREHVTGESARTSVASAGTGLRIAVSTFATGIELAKPLTRPVASEEPDGHDTRVFGSLSYRF